MNFFWKFVFSKIVVYKILLFQINNFFSKNVPVSLHNSSYKPTTCFISNGKPKCVYFKSKFFCLTNLLKNDADMSYLFSANFVTFSFCLGRLLNYQKTMQLLKYVYNLVITSLTSTGCASDIVNLNTLCTNLIMCFGLFTIITLKM